MFRVSSMLKNGKRPSAILGGLEVDPVSPNGRQCFELHSDNNSQFTFPCSTSNDESKMHLELNE